MQALGMIEVIGLPPAIEAADSALKAANVTLLAIAKADAGILTVEITGDVGAVTAAVDAGAAAAERVGTLRAKHVIPHVDESLVGKMLMKGTKLFQPKNKIIKPISNGIDSGFTNSQADGVRKESTLNIDDTPFNDPQTDQKNTTNMISENNSNIGRDDIFGESTIDGEKNEKKYEKQDEKQNEKPYEQKDEKQIYTVTDLKKKSNDTLRAILQSQGVELTEHLKSAKKQELIQLIIAQQNRR